MTVTDGKRQCIRSIIRLRNLLQVQDPLGHFHNLPFFCLTVPHHCLLDLRGSILGNRHSMLHGSKQDHPSCLCHVDAGGLVGVEK